MQRCVWGVMGALMIIS